MRCCLWAPCPWGEGAGTARWTVPGLGTTASVHCVGHSGVSAEPWLSSQPHPAPKCAQTPSAARRIRHLGNGSKSTVGLHPHIVCPWLMLSQPGLTPPPGAAGWWWWWWEGAELCPGFTMRWHCNGGSAATECSHCTAPCFPALLPGPALQPCSAPRAFGPLVVWRWLWGRMEVEAALYVCVYVFFFPIPFELFLSSFPSPALIVGRAVRLQVPPLCCFGAVPLWGHCTAHPTELLVSPHTRRSPPAFPPLHPRDQPSAKPRLPALDLDTEQALI